jgi:hypothetical protein
MMEGTVMIEQWPDDHGRAVTLDRTKFNPEPIPFQHAFKYSRDIVLLQGNKIESVFGG